MKKVKYLGEVRDDGSLKIYDRQQFDKYIKSGFTGQRIVLEVSKYQKQRSLSQNGYYHAVVVPAVKDGLVDAGFSKYSLDNETVHEMLKQKFLKEDIANESGEFITITRSTSTLNTVEFCEYIASIQRWATEFLSIYIPDPMEQSQLNFS